MVHPEHGSDPTVRWRPAEVPGGTPGAAADGDGRRDAPQWLAHIAVDDLEAKLDAVRERGGDVVAGPKGDGPGSYAVIRDPAGAVLALITPSA